MKKLYTLLSLFAIGLFVSYSYFISDDIIEDNPINKNRITKIFSQKKSYVKGKIKKDSPNEFANYHQQIRTSFGDEFPKYKSNYKIKELDKALALSPIGKKSSLDWISRGPGNVGGRSRGIIIDPDEASANTWFIAAVGGGVWKTSDAGANWEELTKDVGSLSASYMAMAPSNHDVIYLGTGEGFGNLDALGGQGIWKSIDRGITWNQLENTTVDSFIINRIIVDPNDENILLAATSIANNSASGLYAGIWKSIDGGENWERKYTTSSKVQQIVCDPTDFSIQYATSNNGNVLKSIDSGETWNISKNGMTASRRIEMAVSPVNTDILYASVDNGTSNSEVYVSKDKAISWSKLNTSMDFLGGQGWYDNAIIADPYEENIFYVAGVNIYKLRNTFGNSVTVTVLTDNYGSNSALHKGTHVDNHFFAVAKLDDAEKKYRLVGTNDGGVCYTDDNGDTFKQPTIGFITSQFYGVDKANGKDRYIGGMQDNSCYRSPVNPSSLDPWTYTFGGDGFDVIWNYEDENKVMLTSQYNNIAITHSGIENLNSTGWMAKVDKGSDDAPFFSKLAQSKQYSNLVFAHGKNGIWRTEDFGKEWTNISMPYGFKGTYSSTEVKISLAEPSVVWAGTSLTSSRPIYLSTDFGKTFLPVNSSTDAKSNLSGLATHPTDEKIAFVLLSSSGNAKILRTTDLGQTWNDISGFVDGTNGKSNNGFPDVAVYDLLVMPYNTDIIWAGTEIGIFESTDNGATWEYSNNGLPAVAVYDILIVNDEVVVGTHGRGIWSVSLPELEGYEPREAVLPIDLVTNYLYQDSKEYSELSISAKSNYDNIKIFVNGNLETEFANVTKGEVKELTIELIEIENVVKIVSIVGEKNIETVKNLSSLALKASSSAFINNFDEMTDLSSEFTGEGYFLSTPSGFDDKAINSAHSYLEDKTVTLYLRTPIVVNADFPEISYKDVAIIEPGESGTSYPEQEFWDYVTIEGSKDGKNWTPMITPYDASFNSDWLSIYNTTNAKPTKNNYITHITKTTDFFSAGDVVLIRFRLFSDAAAVGWGWVIDDLKIQEGALGIDKYSLNKVELSVYPNPISNNTVIDFPEKLRVSNLNYELHDISGRLIIKGEFNSLQSKIALPFDVSRLEKGNYIFSVNTEEFFAKSKLIK